MRRVEFLMPGLAVLSGLVLSGSAPAADEKKPSYAVQTVKDVVYYDGPGQHKVKHKLDLYLPRGLKDFPVLFFVHGGAWVHGDKDFFGLYALFAASYVRQGVGVVVTNYRLSPAVQHPEHIKDVARAFAWCHKNIATYGGRADRLFVCGHSAGAHLVSLLASDESYLKEHGLTSKAIRGVIPISGPMIIPARFMPRVFGTDEEVRKKASPLSHVRKGLPPFLVLYADKDLPGCDGRQAERFCKACKGQGNKVELVEIKNSDHIRIMVSAGDAKHLVFDSILGFIRSNCEK